jgi:Kyakuja-Dileera-Zisupton transposase
MPMDEYNRLSFSVSIFHMYGHEFKCRALYNPRRTSGAGLTDGEGNERIWSKMRCPYFQNMDQLIERHLISSIRASSDGSRIQFLTSNLIEIGEIQRLHFSNMLPRLIKTACSRAQESWKTLHDLLQQTNLTLTELQQQNHNMEEHYKRNKDNVKPTSIHYDDEICELLLCREII